MKRVNSFFEIKTNKTKKGNDQTKKMEQQLSNKQIVITLNFTLPQQKEEEEKKCERRRNDCQKNGDFSEDKLTHLQQEKKRMLEKLEQATPLPEKEKERLNRRLSCLNRKLETFSSQGKEQEKENSDNRHHYKHHNDRRNDDGHHNNQRHHNGGTNQHESHHQDCSREERRSFWKKGRDSFSNLEEKMTFVEEKKKKLSELLQTPNLEEERRKRMEKKLSCLNSRLERLSKQKTGEKNCEKKDSTISSPKVDSSEAPKEKREKRLESLKVKKQFLEKKLEEVLLSSSSDSNSDSEGESNKRAEHLLSRLSKVNQKIEKISQNPN